MPFGILMSMLMKYIGSVHVANLFYIINNLDGIKNKNNEKKNNFISFLKFSANICKSQKLFIKITCFFNDLK